MKNVKLNRMRLHNFQGIQSLDIDFGGASAAIYGDNGTGKTTVANAFMWGLFDKPYAGTSFSPKTRTKDGEMHRAEHSVELMLEVDDKSTSFKKVFREKYAKKRGGIIEEFTGHTTEYFVDDVPVKENEYSDRIEEFIDIAISDAILLVKPDAFPALGWEQRRKLLFACCGDMSDDGLLQQPEHSELKQRLSDKYSVEAYRQLMKSRQAECKKELQTIPARIDELTRQQESAPNAESIRLQLGVLQQQINDAQAERAAITNKITDTAVGELNAAQSRLEGHRGRLSKKKLERERLRSEIKQLEADRQALLKRWNDVQATRFDENSTICPTCGQSLPQENISALKQKFDTERKEKLSEITAEAQHCTAQIIAEKNSVLAAVEAEISGADAAAKAAADEVSRLTEAMRSTSDDSKLSSCNEVIAELMSQQSELMRSLSVAEAAEGCAKRIDELKEQEKKVAAAYEDASLGLHLCGQFEAAKADALTEQINSRFKSVRFKLFKELVNGEIKEDCEILMPSAEGNLVPYAFANNAAKINAGLEICNTLADFYGVALPIFIDNAESVTKIQATTAQAIRLVVSESDKTLRVEEE